jgi:hypothetical protein
MADVKRIRFGHVLAPLLLALLREFVVEIVVLQDRALRTLRLVNGFVVEIGEIAVAGNFLFPFGIADRGPGVAV